MKQYKTIEIIERFDKLCSSGDPTEEDCFFMDNYSLKLAEGLLFNFGEEDVFKNKNFSNF